MHDHAVFAVVAEILRDQDDFEDSLAQQRVEFFEHLLAVLALTFGLPGIVANDIAPPPLTIAVTHSGSQTDYLKDIFLHGQGGGQAILYNNSFEAIPARVQFRPKRETPWPRFSGVKPGSVTQ